MNELLKRFIAEKSNLEDHILHGELHQYIDDNADDLNYLLSKAITYIKLLIQGDDQNAA